MSLVLSLSSSFSLICLALDASVSVSLLSHACPIASCVSLVVGLSLVSLPPGALLSCLMSVLCLLLHLSHCVSRVCLLHLVSHLSLSLCVSRVFVSLCVSWLLSGVSLLVSLASCVSHSHHAGLHLTLGVCLLLRASLTSFSASLVVCLCLCFIVCLVHLSLSHLSCLFLLCLSFSCTL